MRIKYLFIIAVSIFVFSISSEAQSEKSKKEYFKTVTFYVSMSCENCVKTIEKNIAYEKGIKDMKVNLEKKNVTLKFDTRKTNEEKIIEAFERFGYQASVVTETKQKNRIQLK